MKTANTFKHMATKHSDVEVVDVVQRASFKVLGALKNFRSPILDVPTVDWEERDDDLHDTLWVLNNFEVVPMYVLPYANLWMYSKVFGKPVANLPQYGSLTTQLHFQDNKSYQSAVKAMTGSKESVRVSAAAKGGFNISMRVGSLNFESIIDDTFAQTCVFGQSVRDMARTVSDSGGNYNEPLDKNRKDSLERLFKLFGSDLVVPHKALDLIVKPSEVFTDSVVFNQSELEVCWNNLYDSPLDPDVVKEMRAGVRNIRVIGTPTRGAKNIQFYQSVSVADKEALGITTEMQQITSWEAAVALEKAGIAGVQSRWMEACLEGRNYYVYITLFIDSQRSTVMCQQADPAKIDLYDMNEWMQQWLHYQDSGDSSWTMSRLEDIHSMNNRLTKRGLKPKSRTDSLGFTVHPEGMLLWIPEGYDKVTEHKATSLAVNTDTKTGEFSLRNDKWANLSAHSEALDAVGEKVPENHTQENRLLYVDWYNNKLAYTNTSGVQSTLDLERCMPLSPNHIYRLLQIKVGSYSGDSDTESVLTMIRTLIRTWITFNGKSACDAALNAVPEWSRVFGHHQRDKDSFVSFVQNGDFPDACVVINNRLTDAVKYKTNDSETHQPLTVLYPWIEDSYGDTCRMHLVSTDSVVPAFRVLAKILQEATTWATENLQKYIGSQSILTSLNALGISKIIVASFGKVDDIRKADEQQRSVYLNANMVDVLQKPAGFPLMAEDRLLQPHQVKCEAYLEPSPQYSILKVQAGGGKTALVLLDILRNLKKGIVKKPLVMCPDHLVKDYVAEANYFANGRVNVICVNGESLNNWGEDKLLKLVNAAPVNTVVISSYDFMKSRIQTVMYGREELNISLNCELMRLMGFDGAWLDESHFLRNVNQRSISVQRLMAEIPFKRLCTGTLVVDQLTDVANQFALLDPTVFGTKDRFIEKYAESMMGGKVGRWKPGAENEVNRIMSQFCMVVSAQRKEWAALLPPRIEKFHFVPLSDAQRGVYDAILAETLEEIKAKDPELYKKLTLGDEENADDLEGLLGQYLQRLEQFLTSPVRDKAGVVALRGADAESPKAKEIEKIIRSHFDNNCQGKILIFTSYVASAETIYDSLPPDLKAMCIHYTAGKKFECAERYARDKKMQIMVGVEQSMNTGLNLQMASRLIRVESVWSPGVLEQGESRINRPLLKGAVLDDDGSLVTQDKRTNIWFDWVVVNQSIDVTKIGRLIGKLVSSVKFENPNEDKYDRLPDVPLISMNLKSLKEHNDAYETLSEHLDAFDKMRVVQEEDYDDYRHNPKINRKFEALTPNEPLKGAALLREVPYTSGMELFGADKLGIQTYAAYCRENPDAEVDPTGLMIHTEWGDGEVYGVTKNRLKVRLTSDAKISVGKLAAFIITRKSVSTASIKAQLAKLSGLKQADPIELEGDGANISPVDADIDEVVEKPKARAKKGHIVEEPKVKTTPADKTEPDPKKIKQIKVTQPIPDSSAGAGEVELWLSVVNGMYCLSADGNGATDISVLKPYGFKTWDKNYLSAEVHNARQMNALVEQLISKFEIPQSFATELTDAAALFDKGRTRLLNPDLATKSEFRVFYLSKLKQCGPNEVRPYVYIQTIYDETTLYILIDMDKCPAAAKIRTRIRVPGVVWTKEDNWITYFTTSKSDIAATMKAIKADGIIVTNEEEVKDEYRKLRGVRK